MFVGRDLPEGEHLTDGGLQLLLPVPGFDGDGSAVGDQTLQLWNCGLEIGKIEERRGEVGSS